MARIPTIQRTQGLDTASGTIPNTRLTGAVGEAVSDLGNVATAIGERLAARENQRQQFLGQQGFMQVDAGFQDDLVGLEQNMDPTGKGFHDAAMAAFDKRANTFLASLPENLREPYSQRIQTLRMSRSTDAAKSELGRWNTYQVDETTKVLDRLATNIAQSGPDRMESYIVQGEATINSMSIPPTAKREMAGNWRKMAQTAALTTMSPEERLRALGEALNVGGDGEVTGQIVDRIIGVESGGDPTAKNPNSSATGAGQFTSPTWLSMIQKYRPDLAEGKSRDQILQMRNSYGISREMTQRYAEENSAALRSAGMPTTAGNIYLAHFLGPAGAVAMLKADPNADAASVNPQAAASNRSVFYKRGNPKSVAQIIAWADRKMGGEGNAPASQRPLSPPDPRFADIDFDTRIKLITGAEKEIQAAQVTAQAQLKNEFSLRIATNDPTMKVQDILNSSLNDGDKTTLVNSLNSRSMIAPLAAALNDAISANGRASLNPFDADNRKVGDAAYNQRIEGIPTEARPIVQREFVAATGYIPKGLATELQYNATSRDPGRLALGLAHADAIDTESPQAFGAMEGVGDFRERLDLYRHFTRDRGMSSEEAAAEILRRETDTDKINREALKTEANKFVAELTTSDATAAFDTWLPFDEPSAGNQIQANILMSEFRSIASDMFYKTGGDAAAAKALARGEVKRKWGISALSGERVLMRIPPEKYYPPVGGSHAYLREDALKTAKQWVAEAFPDREVTNVFVLATPDTRADLAASRPPRFQLGYTYEAEGQDLADYVTGGWAADIDAAREVIQQKFEKEREREARRPLVEFGRPSGSRVSSPEGVGFGGGRVVGSGRPVVGSSKPVSRLFRDNDETETIISPDGSKRQE